MFPMFRDTVGTLNQDGGQGQESSADAFVVVFSLFFQHTRPSRAKISGSDRPPPGPPDSSRPKLTSQEGTRGTTKPPPPSQQPLFTLALQEASGSLPRPRGGPSVLVETALDAASALRSLAWTVLNRLQTLVEPRSMKSALAGAGAALPRPPSRPPSEGSWPWNVTEL